MAKSCRVASGTKPSKGVFRTQLYIQDGAFIETVHGFMYFCKKVPFYMFDWGQNMPLPSIHKRP